jgi:hypothetical protein
MKAALNIVSVILMAGGIVLGLDGIKVLNLFASGHRRWLLIGAVLLIVGIVVLTLNNRGKAKA